MKRAFWTPEQDAILRDGFDTMTLAELCQALRRKPNAVGCRAELLGLTPMGTLPQDALRAFWTAEVMQ